MRNGRLAVYIKQGLQSSVFLKANNSMMEYFRLQITDDNEKWRCFQTPSRTNNVDDFFRMLDKLCSSYVNIILCGERNINILLNAVLFTNLRPTRFALNSIPAVLVLVCVSDSILALRYIQFPRSVIQGV